MSLIVKSKSSYWWIQISYNKRKYERTTKTDNKEIAQKIHDRFCEQLKATGSPPNVRQIAKECKAEGNNDAATKLTKAVRIRAISTPVVQLSYRQEKFKIRKMLLQMIEESIKGDIFALTLPGTEWIFERDLLLTGRCKKVVGLENDKNRYAYCQDNVPNDSRISYLNMSDMDYAKTSPKDKFNVIWLDYMGRFTKTPLTVWEELLKRKVNSECLLSVTFEARRETDSNDLYKDFIHLKKDSDTTLNTVRQEAVPRMYLEAGMRHGYVGQVLKSEIYKEEANDNKRVSPMLFVIIKFTKEAKEDMHAIAIRMLKEGATSEEVASETGFRPQQIRAFKAHITMKTY